jgi:peptidoglycan/LPS O-acetylase OafA/YrhL
MPVCARRPVRSCRRRAAHSPREEGAEIDVGQPVVATARVKPRLIGLDVLRLVAIMLVLGRHLPPPPATWPSGWRSIFLTWQRGGWVGVDLFFVLSGFLVSGLLFTEYNARRRLSIGRFFIRRGWKIYPPFATLIAATVIGTLIAGRPIDRRSLLSEVMFLQSYLYGMWDHTWSLAVEEHFYLLLPLVLTLTLKLNRGSPTPLKPVLAVAGGVAVLSLGLRLLTWRFQPTYSHLTHLFASHLRLDALFFGVAISYAYHFHTSRFIESLSPWRRWLIAGGILLLTPAFAFQLETTPFIFTVGLTLFYLGSGMLMVGTFLCDLPRSRPLVVIATLGAYSYSIYLWHLCVQDWGGLVVGLAWGRPPGFAVRTTVYLVGSLALGVFMAKIVEVPALQLRDRWFPSRTTGAIGTPPVPQ